MIKSTEPGLFSGNSLYRIRFVMWLLLVLLHLITSFHRVSFNVLADLLMAEFHLTGAGLGNLAAAYTYMYLIMQIPGGVLVDRLGPKRIALFTGLTMATGSIIIGLAPNAGMVFLGRLVIGLGGSVILINIFKFQAVWFKRHEFATMSGFAVFTSSIGTLLAATPLALTVDLIGWRVSFLVIGLLTVIIAILGYRKVQNQPVNLKRQYVASSNPEALEINPVPIFQAVGDSLKNHRIWLLLLINAGTFGGLMVFSGTWGVSYLVHTYGFSVEKASYYMAVTLIGYMLGAPLIGFIADRIGSHRKLALITAVSFLFAWIAILAWPGGIVPGGLLYGICFLLGFGSAGTMLTFPMAREISPPGYTGSVTATVNLGIFLGMAILQPLVGYILDLGWDGMIIDGARIYPLSAYRLGFLSCLIFAGFALAAVLAFREKRPNY